MARLLPRVLQITLEVEITHQTRLTAWSDRNIVNESKAGWLATMPNVPVLYLP